MRKLIYIYIYILRKILIVKMELFLKAKVKKGIIIIKRIRQK